MFIYIYIHICGNLCESDYVDTWGAQHSGISLNSLKITYFSLTMQYKHMCLHVDHCELNYMLQCKMLNGSC